MQDVGKEELIAFWCVRAREGRARSAASARVGWRDVLSALRLSLSYLFERHSQVDTMVVAHGDRGAETLADIPYVGAIASRLARRGPILLLQMGTLRPTPGVVRYPWLAMRIAERLLSQVRSKLSPEDAKLAGAIAEKYGIDRGLVAARLRRLNFEVAVWERLLDRHKPKRILLVDGYSSNNALVLAARRRKIVTIEAQHGSCVRSHVGYQTIARSSRQLHPDYFLAWNDFWKNEIENVDGYGARAKLCPATAQRLKGIGGGEGRGILIIHQPTVSHILHDLLESLPALPAGASRLTVKYHPGIQPDWKPRLDALCRDKGVAVIESGPIEEAIPRFGVVVGWFSTVLYQARDAGSVVHYLPADGFEEQQRPLASQGIEPLTRAELLSMASR